MITAPSRDVGADLAKRIVAAKLAACVNLVNGVESFYWWEGAVQSDQEILLIVKTDQERVAELRDRVLEWHPYDTPEFIVFEITDGSASYLSWIRESVGVS